MPFKACVVSTGGGVVERRRNWGYMQHGIVIWLDGPPELLARRACQDGQSSRPLLGSTDQARLCANSSSVNAQCKSANLSLSVCLFAKSCGSRWLKYWLVIFAPKYIHALSWMTLVRRCSPLQPLQGRDHESRQVLAGSIWQRKVISYLCKSSHRLWHYILIPGPFPGAEWRRTAGSHNCQALRDSGQTARPVCTGRYHCLLASCR